MENTTRRERERQIREEEIIEAAEKIFYEKGYDDASMAEIALAAQFTRKTLYQYFVNKEELYFAAALKGFEKLTAYLLEAVKNEQTGYMKIYKSSIGYYKFYKDHPQTLRLIGYLGRVKKKSKLESQRKVELDQYNYKLFQSVAKAIEEGKNDGSIRKDLDAEKAAVSLIFMMTGFFNQLAATGETFMENFSLEGESFCSFSMDLLFKSIINNTQ